ncbi:hypothetical protein BOTBODRAFT_121950 [Botryobasidium botryosum FD-172 SS1]|uniref:Uncharacterized protein n=1 Tax=Botryobasidium botryosum (strain FD-172 SS1) TaxID=930990 RepID=A0A067LUW3_BOTB1|nr:hypothetical protein BOTBODRAFT_121950 [Botryobasidium botryosum FD-172 SS1]
MLHFYIHLLKTSVLYLQTKIQETCSNDVDGATLLPFILGSDKTIVSVGTGHVEYYPLYGTSGNFHNDVRRAHRDAIVPIAFLAIPKCDRKNDNDSALRTFKRQLFHASLSHILTPLKQGMTTPEIIRFPDGYFCRTIFSLGPYIADYPEQVLLACIVSGWCPRCRAKPWELEGIGEARCQLHTDAVIDAFTARQVWDAYGIVSDVIPFTNDFPRADITQLLAPDLLHQVIKGAFKDHLVEWIWEYLKLQHGEARAKVIMDDIDRCIASAPSFPGLRRFPDGRRFSQWTGNDSKALMKVLLPVLVGHLPAEIIRCVRSFLDLCYLLRQYSHDEDDLVKIDETFAEYCHHREFFRQAGVCPDGFGQPRQHSLGHYRHLIQLFGSPNGLCSSITESRHITAVKEPYRRSNRWNAISQITLTNQRLDKLSAAHAHFTAHGMMHGTVLSSILNSMLGPFAVPPSGAEESDGDSDDDSDDDEIGPADEDDALTGIALARTPVPHYPRDPMLLGAAIGVPSLLKHIRVFLHRQCSPTDSRASHDIPIHECPDFIGHVKVFHSAAATFFAPCDKAGITGMTRELIRAVPSWRGEGPRHDCVFIKDFEAAPGLPGFRALRVSRV